MLPNCFFQLACYIQLHPALGPTVSCVAPWYLGFEFPSGSIELKHVDVICNFCGDFFSVDFSMFQDVSKLVSELSNNLVTIRQTTISSFWLGRKGFTTLSPFINFHDYHDLLKSLLTMNAPVACPSVHALPN